MNETASWHDSYDVVVVGSGTGLMGAITAARRGLRALVVEKGAYFGGSTAMSGGGMWMPNNRLLQNAGVQDTKERVLTYLDTLVGDTAPRARREAFVEHAPEVVDELLAATPLKLGHMTEYADYFADLEGGSAIGRSVESAPFDINTLGAEDAARIRTSGAIAAPVPMPITSKDFRLMNLMARRPLQAFPTIFKRVLQGVGGKLLKKDMAAGGRALGAGLIAGARRAGVGIWLNSPLKELVVEDGRVTGVVVEKDGERMRVAAKGGVILAIGGFDHAGEQRRKYQSQALTEDWSFGNPDNTGDLFAIAEQVGAGLDLLDQAWWFPSISPLTPGADPIFMLSERSLPGSMIVDSTGHRFFNEATDYMTAGRAMLGLDDGKGDHLPIWLIFDQTHRNRYLFAGSVMPRMPMPKIFYESGVVVKAKSIAELSRKIGVPGLVDGAAHFNVLASQGQDDDFKRGLGHYDRYYGDSTNTPNPNLGTITKAPFYAVKTVPADLGTCGGITADEWGRALHEDGSPIDGLYAVGNAAANAFGTFYPGPGATLGQGLVFAYLAAKHAGERARSSERARPDAQF
ncbi:3-ketosteroid-delta-1-dehydrogenase [Micromonospora sonchi]|uniref:3-oxosteroid 1-dehydrogenase n=1 Tax=Micromonospora sonchi TaxID=1763543 RepID=A0A917X0P9_9ACTN|nr:FAD-dependent oxidoreductase [Micromonospora sonchi]GGM48979.1 3-ketosteroid-delta-1-dehydrogenase [Micromonospora sonchi]